MDVDESGTRDDVLVGCAAEARRQGARQRGFAVAAGREVRVAGLGRRGHEAAPDAVQQRLAEARPGRDEGGVAGGFRGARPDDRELVAGQGRHRVRERGQVVQQRDACDRELRADAPGVDAPGDVRQLADLAAHRAGDAEAGRLQRSAPADAAQERRDELGQPAELERREAPHRLRPRRRRPAGVEPEQRLRAPDVTCEQHPGPCAAPRGSLTLLSFSFIFPARDGRILAT